MGAVLCHLCAMLCVAHVLAPLVWLVLSVSPWYPTVSMHLSILSMHTLFVLSHHPGICVCTRLQAPDFDAKAAYPALDLLRSSTPLYVRNQSLLDRVFLPALS